MLNFVKHLRAAWRYATSVPYLSFADEWSFVDRTWLNATMQQDSGKKFAAVLRNHAIQLACNAVRNPENSQYNNGVAAGMFMIISDIEQLSAVGAIPDTESEQGEDALSAFAQPTS